LYCGFRSKVDFEVYRDVIETGLTNQKLQKLNVAYSREGGEEYVIDLLINDAELIMQLLSTKGVLMLCGSLSMQKDITTWLEEICMIQTGKSLSYYQSHGQVLMDCY
jgi:sulfite reductase (NADPH) flavoprotein alpha-component